MILLVKSLLAEVQRFLGVQTHTLGDDLAGAFDLHHEFDPCLRIESCWYLQVIHLKRHQDLSKHISIDEFFLCRLG
jgi:hypothetical protein